MYLPDKIVIDLYEVDLVIDKIAKFLKEILKITACGEVLDVGNDIDYVLKDINSFKKKLFNLILKEAKKYQTDIFGNIIQSFNKYRYIEIMFSEDYREITSVRLFGQTQGGDYSRYSLFNLPNTFDPTTITLLYNFNDILENAESIIGQEIKYIEFLKNYFSPFPLMHPLKPKDLKCLDNISKKEDSGKEKTFDEWKEQTKKFESIDFKMPLFDIRGPSFTQIGAISFILPEIDAIIKKIEISETADNPKNVINIIQTTIFDKFKIPDITGFIFDGLNITIDPFKFLTDLEPIDIISKIDDLPKPTRDEIYKILNAPDGPVNLPKLMIDLQEFLNFKLNLPNINLDLSKLLNEILIDIEKIKIPEIMIDLVNLKAPEFQLKKPDVSLKLNEIKTKIDEWILKIRDILFIFNNNPLINVLSEKDDTIQSLNFVLGQFEEFKLKLPNFSNNIFDVDFNQKLDLSYEFIKTIKLPDLYFNLSKLINAKIKKNKCNVKLPKPRLNLKLTELFKKIKIKFPKLYIDFKNRFNFIFPKINFLEELKKIIDFDIFKIKIPNIDLPKFKLPNFDFDIPDLFKDFSSQIDNNILKAMSSILSQITKTLLELLNSLNKLDDFAFENMFPLPQLNIPDTNIPKYQLAFNEDWLIYIEYVYRLLTETDKQRTEPQIIKLPSNIVSDSRIRDSIRNRKIPKPIDICEPRNLQSGIVVSKKELKNRNINNIQDAIEKNDIDSLIEKMKEYQFSDLQDYLRTANSDDDIAIDVLRFISKTLKETPNQRKPKLPISSTELIKKTSDMIEQIETILDQKEMNSLLNGTYSDETAEIVRNIAKINFPDLTYKVDPIKYFRMLGKVIGSKNTPKFGYNQALNAVGIKK